MSSDHTLPFGALDGSILVEKFGEGVSSDHALPSGALGELMLVEKCQDVLISSAWDGFKE